MRHDRGSSGKSRTSGCNTYEEIRPSLLRVAITHGGAGNDPEDIAQQAFADHLGEERAAGEPIQSHEAWLIARACRLCASVRRGDRCPVGPMREAQAAGSTCARLESPDPGPAEGAACREEIERLRLALRQLLDEERQIVQWEYFDGRTAGEANAKVAGELGVCPRQAQRKRAQALEHLRSVLRERSQGAAR
jgi:DNA-directed RNA polymerase specialized sigma24 family protein